MFKCSGSVFLAVFLFILLSTGLVEGQLTLEELEKNYKCIIPAYDVVKNGRRNLVRHHEDKQPGTKVYFFDLEVTCNPGYTLMGENFIRCLEGTIFPPFPKCIRSCPSIAPDLPGGDLGYNDKECLGTGSTLAATTECGRGGGGLNTGNVPQVANGTLATLSDAPWHAGVYQKTTRPYMQICGGTIISANVIISAAHCFWSEIEKKLPARNYAVAVGKLYREWDDPKRQNMDAQKSDIKEIRIPPRFQGRATNFQDDIAALVLVTPLMFTNIVVPVCLDFNYDFDGRQLAHGKKTQVVGWGLTSADGAASQVLYKAELPVVGIEQCIAQSQPEFLESVTSDKICAGYNNGTSVCPGDSGGGLAIEQFVNGGDRYFLRGIVSTAPTDDHLCNVYSVATFTHVFRHEHFIKEALKENPTPEVEVTTKSTQLVDEAITPVNKEIPERLNFQTTTEINYEANRGGEAIPSPGQGTQILPISGGLNQKNPNNGVLNPGEINQGAINPLVIDQKAPNQAGLSQGCLNQAVIHGSINNKVSTIPGSVGFNLGFNQVPNQGNSDKIELIQPTQGQVGLNLVPINSGLQAVPNREYLPQNNPNQGSYNPHGIHQVVFFQGPVNQEVPSQQVLNQGVLPQGVSNQAGLNHGVPQQIPLPGHSVDKSKVPINLLWMTNYDYQQYWQQNSPNNKQSTDNFNYNHQLHWHDSPNNQPNHQNSPNNQQNHQNVHSHNWHNAHDHHYNYHQNW